ncbi:Omp85 family outer membrane protein [Plebeiibacterium marinum]|uniref:Bacterial surface antigen (D15) domain-containing protein n=1 Tax=Plebeiibacterium marinum TaxID=2992111 RepID=A0AAE3SIT8_9BACT|nr:hypothetical protein [Plebeiobacterium marinum]MCW3805040.1 hypothetical protein [Plebeiobacterium marinum]
MIKKYLKGFYSTNILLGLCLCVCAQEKHAQREVVNKQGWTFGALPVIAFNSDEGFKYGGLVNFFDYGDGVGYPDYNRSLYVEWSRTTKGSGINQMIYDSKVLIPNTRLIAEISYKTEQALDFYGFNGYGAFYNPDYEDQDHSSYLSRMFYRIDRSRFVVKSDFHINLIGTKLRALAGVSFVNIKTEEVDIDKLNKGLSKEDKLPEHEEQPGLYRYYVDAGIIPAKEKKGGANGLIKIGGIFDTRDVEANPGKGVWAEAFLLANPGFDGSAYVKVVVNWHQYNTVVPDYVNFAYRLSYQPKVFGDIPWYMRPNIYNSRRDRYGLGGVYSLRGIVRNRIVGDGVAFANFELRTILLRTVIKKQNFYLGLVPFVDMGMVTNEVDVDYSLLPADVRLMVQPETDQESIHASYGAELKFVLNDNFIVSTSYGRVMDKRDGNSGFYIDLNYMF